MQGFTLFNTLVGVGTIGVLLVSLSLLVLLFLTETKNRYVQFWQKYSLVTALGIALFATIGSLMYEFGFGLPPCTFCWWQRIFMYPQVIVLGIALVVRDTKVWLSGVVLSVIGAFFSLYHIMLQTGIRAGGASCELNGVSCTSVDVIIFGWITIPIMCLSAFIGILVMMFLFHKKTA